MNFTVIDCEQKSPEWFAARLGRLTGTGAPDMCRTIKSGEAASRRDLRMRLALERLTGTSQETEFDTAAVAHGRETEAAGLAHYEGVAGVIVERTGFITLLDNMAGCSLDGFVENRTGIVELKAPKSATHLEYLKTREIPRDYRFQCIHNMWVTGAAYCDFVSVDFRFPEELQYLCVRLERDEAEIRAYEALATKFLAEVTVEVNEINSMRRAA